MDLEQAMSALNEANVRITELEGQMTTLTGERDTASGRASELEAAHAALSGQLADVSAARETLAGHLEEVQRDSSSAQERGLAHLLRALLAEHAGQVVPELVGGADETALLASVDLAKQAHSRALEAARAAIANQTVPAGAPSLRSVSTTGLTPLEMIESGLRK
jgi:chromosome segregation ATPase